MQVNEYQKAAMATLNPAFSNGFDTGASVNRKEGNL